MVQEEIKRTLTLGQKTYFWKLEVVMNIFLSYLESTSEYPQYPEYPCNI
jgi:hypothetical protein